LPGSGNFCPAATANISTLRKRRGGFLGKILVKKRAYEKIEKKRAALARRSSIIPKGFLVT
jgi:hypothetical protein